MEVLRAEIKTITDNDEATEDEVARADTLLEEWKEKEVVRQKALTRETQVDEVMRAALSPGNRESTNDRRGPEIMRKVDPYDQDTYKELARSVRYGGDPEKGAVTFEPEPIISRAMKAVEEASRFVGDDDEE